MSRPAQIDRYLLLLLAKPFAGTLALALVALLLERLLRLVDLIASKGARPFSVLRVLADLVPHYLGLALPAALFISIYFAVAGLSRNGELEAMQAVGLSLARIGRPFILVSAVTAVAAFALYGYGQPYARYAYRADFQAVLEGGWNATITPGEITRVSANLFVTADGHDRRTDTLSHVLVFRRYPSGREDVTTGRSGSIALSDAGTEVLLSLDHGEQLTIEPDKRLQTLSSDLARVSRPFSVQIATFRPRGVDEREMTLGELWADRANPTPMLPPRRLDSESHSRLVRTLSLLVLPLLAIPAGLSAKRSRKHYGVVVGLVFLVLYDHLIQLAQSFGASGRIDPRPALWAVLALFAALCAFLFHQAQAPGGGPFNTVSGLLDQAAAAVGHAWRGPRKGRRI